MKTVSELEREFSAIKAKRIPRAQKLPLAREILNGIAAIEKAAFDFSGAGIHIAELRAAREFQGVIEEYLR